MLSIKCMSDDGTLSSLRGDYCNLTSFSFTNVSINVYSVSNHSMKSLFTGSISLAFISTR